MSDFFSLLMIVKYLNNFEYVYVSVQQMQFYQSKCMQEGRCFVNDKDNEQKNASTSIKHIFNTDVFCASYSDLA